MVHKANVLVEIKDRAVSGPMVDQIVGSARRQANRADLVVIVCRGYTRDAEMRRRQHSTEQMRVEFKVVRG
jgi:hypothetical protein